MSIMNYKHLLFFSILVFLMSTFIVLSFALIIVPENNIDAFGQCCIYVLGMLGYYESGLLLHAYRENIKWFK